MPTGMRVSYKRDGTDEREYTKVSLPSPMKSGRYGEGHQKTGSMTVESLLAKQNKDFEESGLIC